MADKDMEMFWEMLDRRLELCKDALMTRHKMLLGVTSDSSPIHWQHGAIARLKKGEKIDKLLKDGYSTISLGYVGIAEMVQAMLGVTHTSKEGEKFALEVMIPENVWNEIINGKIEKNKLEKISQTEKIPMSFIVGRLAKKDLITYRSRLYQDNYQK